MNRFVLTATVVWLFDMIKNVMLPTMHGKKKDHKTEQSSHSQGHCDLPKEAKRPGSDPSPLKFPTWLPAAFGHSPSSNKSWLDRNFPTFTSRRAKATNSEFHALSPSDYHNAFESWCRELELCLGSTGEYFEGM